MYKRLHKLQPVVMQRIWGGDTLIKAFGIETDVQCAGEIVAAGAISGRDCIVEDLGIPLSTFYAQNQDYFGLKLPEFPICINLIDAEDWLSVQVHPDDSYARQHENCCGLPEAWLVIGCKPGRTLIAGHNATSKEAFQASVLRGAWDTLLQPMHVKKGAFISMPAGTVHAIGAGIQIYEITRCADVVYRLYDYNRADPNGNRRQLHIEKAFDVVYAPQRIAAQYNASVQMSSHMELTEYIDEAGVFSMKTLRVNGNAVFKTDNFAVYTILEGAGVIGGERISAGETLLAPCDFGVLTLSGKFLAAVASYRDV
jgi:mannose-6-phosphate isomerase